MKYIVSSLSKRTSIALGVLSILCILSSFPLRAQQASDIKIVPKVTNATCESNGEITCTVTSTNTLYTIQSCVYTYENEETHSLVTSQNTTQPIVTGLPAGSYTLKVEVLFTNGNKVVVSHPGIKVISSYRMPAISIKEERPTLKDYSSPTGMIGLRAVNGSAKHYTAKLLKTPSGYTGYTQFTYPATNSWMYFYDLPAGEYQVQISDECISYPAVEIKVTTTATSFYPNIADNDLIPIRDHCGWYRVWNPTNSNFPYYSSIDTIAKYYDFTFATKADLDANNSLTWHDIRTIPRTLDGSDVVAFIAGSYPLCFKVPEGSSWYKMARGDSRNKLWFAYRLKNTNQMQAYALDYFRNDAWVTHLIDESAGPCVDYKRKLYLNDYYQYDFCPPIKVTVAEKDHPDVILETINLALENKNSNTAIELQTTFSRGKDYVFTYEDGNGDKIKYNIPSLLPETYIYTQTSQNYCEGTRMNRVYIQAIVRTGTTTQTIALDGYTITLKKAPDSYTPPVTHSLRVGVPFEVPEGFGKNLFFPFASETPTHQAFPHRSAQYFLLPAGEYLFDIKDPCGRTKELKITLVSTVDKYSAGPKALKPKVAIKECGRMRIYPFAGGHTDILLKNGVSYDTPLVKVTEYPNGLNSSDIRVFNGSSYIKADYLQAPVSTSTVKPEDIYFDMPLAQGELTLKVSWHQYYTNETCLPTAVVDLNNANISYNRDTYVGYKCPSGTYAFFNIEPLNYVGHLDVEIRPLSGGAPVASLQDVDLAASGGTITIELKPTTPITEDNYLLYLKDRKCVNDNKNGTPISLYDLSSTSVVRTTRLKTKYCEGEPITLEAISLGGLVVYTWHLPDGSTLTGRVAEIAHSEATKHSGHYRLEATNVICEGAPTTITIDFDLSVAPPVLWWASDATNGNWYDKNNWRNVNGVTVNAIPAACTTVHIPSEVDNYYPNLDPAISVQGTYGAAECNDVYFHYGSQLGRPQLLRYSHAYVDYNFGKVQPDGSLTHHAEPHFARSDKRLMARNRWYMLATPLKNILSGDFGLAGYPMTFQRHFKSGLSDPSGLTEGSFEKPVNTLKENMDAFNHAIALKVAGYNTGKVGYKDHKNLNGLNGIIRIPYYLNRNVDAHYPLHKYIDASSTSVFRYYYMATLAPMGRVDSYVRNPEEDFRFVFETSSNKAIGAITVAGSSVEGYAFQLTGDTNSELRMVGNPFMSAIDFDKLVEVNTTLIEPYYYIFTDNTWKTYYKGVTSPASTLQKEILPLQAVVIKKKATGALLFPTEGDKNVLLAPNKDWTLKSRTTNSSDPVRRVSVVATNSAGQGGESILLPDTELSPAPALFYPAIDEVPTVYFVDTEVGTPNIIQSGASLSVVPMGVHSSLMGTIELDFSSLTSNLFTRLSLYDRATRREHDLLANPRYTYQNGANEGTRFELRMEYPGVKSVTSPHTESDLLRVIPGEEGYRVESAVSVQGYTLYGVDGKQLTMDEGVNALGFVVDRVHCQSVTLLRVHLADGSTLTRKLPAL